MAAPAAVAPAIAAARSAKVRIETHVPVEGARLYLLVRGGDPDAPVLVWLHGGPGGAERPLFRLYNGDLEARFIVAYLDQRGAGRSFDEDADPARLTIARHLADLDAVVERLRRRFGRQKVILLGHSWGTALGLLYAHAHPEKVAAFLGTGVETSTLADQQAQIDFVEAEARGAGDAEALAQVKAVGPPPFTVREDLDMQGLLDRYGGTFHEKPNFAWTTVRGVFGGLVSPWEIGRIIQGNNVSLAAMRDELAGLDLTQRVPALDVPAAFLLGRYDRKTDSRLAAAWFERLPAPRKRLVWFERSAHNVPFEEPDAFNAAVSRVLGELGVV
jgi:pimeloyl-ACP methyl ester carboxylesterase